MKFVRTHIHDDCVQSRGADSEERAPNARSVTSPLYNMYYYYVYIRACTAGPHDVDETGNGRMKINKIMLIISPTLFRVRSDNHTESRVTRKMLLR